MSNPDSRFINRFSLIMGVLIIIAIGLIFLSRGIMAVTPSADEPAAATVTAANADANPAAVPAAATATAATAASPAGAGASTSTTAASGEGQSVYQQVCSVCHATGIAGAPKLGDASLWKPRIAQGKATLYDHALHGFAGKTGVMPPKAGHTELSDATVQAAVDYMVVQSGG